MNNTDTIKKLDGVIAFAKYTIVGAALVSLVLSAGLQRTRQESTESVLRNLVEMQTSSTNLKVLNREVEVLQQTQKWLADRTDTYREVLTAGTDEETLVLLRALAQQEIQEKDAVTAQLRAAVTAQEIAETADIRALAAALYETYKSN